MGRKEQLKNTAEKHTESMDRLFGDQIKKSIAETHLYSTEFSRAEKAERSASFALEQSYSQDSIRRNAGKGRLAVMNFASYRHAGGGFINGAVAQEEAICHSSFLYNILREFPEYYKWNEANYNRGLYMNRALYSPEVYFFGDNYESFVSADVITCAAPNRSVMLGKGRFTEEENEEALKDRIRFIRDICDTEGVDILIAGAYGCGVFAQKAETVACAFREVFGDTKVKEVVFAVPPDKNYAAFEREFGAARNIL